MRNSTGCRPCARSRRPAGTSRNFGRHWRTSPTSSWRGRGSVAVRADPAKVARAAAAQALGAAGSAAAVALLRFKARVGDEEPEVMAACLAALMTAAPAESLAFVAEFLDAPSEAVREGAVFALAE